MEDRFKGSLLGLAAGDALGSAVEFQPPGSFDPVRTMRGGGRYGLLPGQWTDDTSMALCFAHSLVRCGGHDPHSELDTYSRWFRTGFLASTCEAFDIGITTRHAVFKHEKDRSDPYPSITNPKNAGNGNLMKLAPLPMFYFNEPATLLKMAEFTCKVTHGAPECLSSSRYFAGLLWGALAGKSKEEILSECYAPIPFPDTMDYTPEPASENLLNVMKGSFKSKEPPEIKASGYCIASLEAALWAFYTTSTFEEGLLKAVNLGDDSDTVGAIYGSLAGAFYGASAIPKEWIESLSFSKLIEVYATQLYYQANQSAPRMTQSLLYQVLNEEYSFLHEHFAQMLRKCRPSPKQYSSLEVFDQDIEEIKKNFASRRKLALEKLSLEGKEESFSSIDAEQVLDNTLMGFTKTFVGERNRVESRLGRK